MCMVTLYMCMVTLAEKTSFLWPDNSDGLRIVSRPIRDAESSQKCCISWNINLYTAKHQKKICGMCLVGMTCALVRRMYLQMQEYFTEKEYLSWGGSLLYNSLLHR